MSRSVWCAVRYPPYAIVKKSLLDNAEPELCVEMTAPRIVDEEAASNADAMVPNIASVNDISSGKRGGLRSRHGLSGRSLQQLRNEARERGLKGRLSMNKGQLEKALQQCREREMSEVPRSAGEDESAA